MCKLKKYAIILCTLIIAMANASVGLANGIDWRAGFVEIEGYGVPAEQAQSAAQARLLAMRAAKSDCYRNMLEMVSGVKVDSQTTVKDMMVANDTIRTQVSGFIKGAQVIKADVLYDGSYRVIMRAPLYGIQGLQAIVNIAPDTEKFNPETSRIILDNTGDTANLVTDDINTNLNWYQGSKNKVDAGKKVDLDIGCFYETYQQKEVLDALNKHFGDFNNSPYISIDIDDRSGNVQSGENLLINGQRINNFKRILIYSYIYKGINQWSELDGVVTVRQSGKPDIIIRLDKPDAGKNMCAIAVIEKNGDSQYKITKLGDYFSGHEAMDNAYNWGFNWHQGRKD